MVVCGWVCVRSGVILIFLGGCVSVGVFMYQILLRPWAHLRLAHLFDLTPSVKLPITLAKFETNLDIYTTRDRYIYIYITRDRERRAKERSKRMPTQTWPNPSTAPEVAPPALTRSGSLIACGPEKNSTFSRTKNKFRRRKK